MELNRKEHLQRWAALKKVREPTLSHWRDLSEYVLPRRSRFLLEEQNQNLRNERLINSTPRRVVRILASGMMAGATPTSRPWFRLAVPDPGLMKIGAVREWLYYTEDVIRNVFAKSNVYNALYNGYTDLATFGTTAIVLEPDPDDMLRGFHYPVGQYCLDLNDRQQVDSFYLEFRYTVRQTVQKFGLDACSDRVRSHYHRKEWNQYVDILLAIEPNDNHDPRKIGPQGFPWRSVWMEKSGTDTDGFLRVGGYREFPVLAPRWEVTGGDVYGLSPAMDALGDCIAVQTEERRKGQLSAYAARPTMIVPTGLMGRDEAFLPGDVIYSDITAMGQKIEPAWTPHPQMLAEVRQNIQEHEARIGQMFYADLWLSLTETDRREITATEVAERHEEKLLQLGPVVERLHVEYLSPLIARAFSILWDAGVLPEPPEELQGSPMKVEYISILAQAQKLLGTSSMERLVGFVGSIGDRIPDVWDKFDFDEAVNLYADALGAPPSVLVPDEVAEQRRAERAQMQQMAQEAELAAQLSKSAKDLSGPMDPESPLAQIAGELEGGLG